MSVRPDLCSLGNHHESSSQRLGGRLHLFSDYLSVSKKILVIQRATPCRAALAQSQTLRMFDLHALRPTVMDRHYGLSVSMLKQQIRQSLRPQHGTHCLRISVPYRTPQISEDTSKLII